MGGFICVWYMEVYLWERLGKHHAALTASFICRAECLMGNWKLQEFDFAVFFFFNEMFTEFVLRKQRLSKPSNASPATHKKTLGG